MEGGSRVEEDTGRETSSPTNNSSTDHLSGLNHNGDKGSKQAWRHSLKGLIRVVVRLSEFGRTRLQIQRQNTWRKVQVCF
jgi:hypothetical protein